jgi:hypothetical protein
VRRREFEHSPSPPELRRRDLVCAVSNASYATRGIGGVLERVSWEKQILLCPRMCIQPLARRVLLPAFLS